MNLAGQLSRLPAEQGMEKVASGKTARLLKLGLPALNRLRKVENPEANPVQLAEAPLTIDEPTPPEQPEPTEPTA